MNTISSYLKADHAHCDHLFSFLECCVTEKRLDELDSAFNNYREAMERHFWREEKILFEALERANRGTAAIKLMFRGHQHLRAIIVRIEEAVATRNTSAFFLHADTLRITLHEHNLQEERFQYLIFNRILRDQQDEIISAMRALDDQVLPPLTDRRPSRIYMHRISQFEATSPR